MTVSIILPCYNPQQGWEENILSFYTSFSQKAEGITELIIVFDGNSKTVSNEIISWIQEKIPSLKIIKYPENKGKGYAIRQGCSIATGGIVIYTDIDIPYKMNSMVAIYDALINNACDVAIGVKDDEYYDHVPVVRKFISKSLQLMIRIFFSMPVSDTQCGLKGFKKEVLPLFIATKTNRYLFDIEFIRNCYTGKKFKVRAIPVTLKENVHFRKMNYRILLPELIDFLKLVFKK